MPYITDEAKARLAAGHHPQDVGELTYAIQQLLDTFLTDVIESGFEVRFRDIAVCSAALHHAQTDFEDRVVRPYEARKAAENGDVWDTRLVWP